MDWVPQQGDLQQLLQLLRDSSSPSNEVQALVQQRLATFVNVPDYNNYLIYILTRLQQEEPSVRAIAGLILKNNIRSHFSQIPVQVREYVKANALQAIGDPDHSVRSTIAIVITTFISRFGITSWPEALEHIVRLLDSTEFTQLEGAFVCLQRICEDSARDLDRDINGQRPLNYIIPKLIQFFQHEHVKIKVAAISCVNNFITTRSQSLFTHINEFCDALFKLAVTDSRPEVQKHVCQAMVMLLESKPDVLMPQLPAVIDYMLQRTQDDDETLALEACEFWLAFAEIEELHNVLRSYLPRVLPVLLHGMIYSDMDLLMMGGDEDDADVQDRPEDIRPRHYKAKTHENPSAKNESTSTPGAATSASTGGEDDDDDDDEDDDDDDDYDDDDAANEWNLRKCSAAALDTISSIFQNDILEFILPLLKERLFAPDWKVRESGILALGAIAEGCISGIKPHLPVLVPYLLQNLNDSKPLVRSITCWTLSRYSEWMMDIPDANERAKFFVPVMEGLLRMVLDNNKRVQEAGCSAFATLEEDAGEELIAYLQPIVGTLTHAFQKYQKRNFLILLDAIGTLADSVGAALASYVDALMPPLLTKWQQLADDDRDLFSLLECLSSVSVALGPAFAPFAGPIWERCIRLISSSLIQGQQHLQSPDTVEEPDKDFVIVSLDLLSGMLQGLGPGVEPYITSSHPPLLPLVGACLVDPTQEVKQSAFALLGDLAIHSYSTLQPYVDQFMVHVLEHIDVNSSNRSVCNNAAWAAGEIALREKQNMEKWIEALLERLLTILLNQETQRTLAENCAITIGRLGLVCTPRVAPLLEVFAENWCIALKLVRDNEEKENAFFGFCMMINANPQGLFKAFPHFCECVALWHHPSPELNDVFGKILMGYKSMIGSNWDAYSNNLPQDVRIRLGSRYGL